MSDDLVKRLRDTPNWKREEYGDYKSASTHYDRAPFEAADRIEELKAKLDWVIVERDETFALMLDRAQAAEAKLAKAVESLEKLARLGNGDLYGNSDGNMIARTTIAELKGETDA
jgi:hypothetical protein